MSETLTGTPREELRRRRVARERERRDYEKRNPWRPSQVTGVYPASDAADGARRGRGGARRRSRRWAALPAAQRAAFFGKAADAIEARAEQIAQDMTAEMGKPLRESRLEAHARRDDPPLRGRRGVAADRRAVRAFGRRTSGSTRCAARSASSA